MKSLTVVGLMMACNSAFANPIVDETLKSKTCKSAKHDKNQIECEYRVGKGLTVVIAGVGDPDASVNFFKSDFDSDYWAAFGLAHQCVIVKSSSTFSVAFISPKNGKVYGDWISCKAGN